MVRGPISLVIVGIVSLVGLAVVFGGPQVFEKVLPPSAISFVDDLGGKAGKTSLVGGAVRAGDSPADFLNNSKEGLDAIGPIAAGAGNGAVFIADVISGYSTQVATDVPAEITTIRPILGCLLTPPQPGTVVGHATSGRSDLATALSTYGDRHLAEAVQTFVNLYRKTGKADPETSAGIAYEAYDVAVTETDTPVYLVLENRYGNRIWNIHLAEGARIERVVLLGGDQAGVANLDPVIPVEVILNDGLDACGIRPAYDLNPGHLFFQSLENGAMSAEEAETRLAALRSAVDAFDVWFRDSFGVLAGQSRVGFDKGTISLIGPVPGEVDPKAVYAPIAGAKIRMTQDKFFEIEGQQAEGEDFASRVIAIAKAFAFGDLDTLRQGVNF
ncbi:MAG: hypothetical protein C0524_02335 [Rhodobacter sp.]|nr:hypothetical protein [Rhodobacter sp.]